MTVKKPSDKWRHRKAEEKSELAAGLIAAEECYMDELFPDAFIEQTDVALNEFATELSVLSNTDNDFPQVMKCIEKLVVTLNQINVAFNESVIETGEREELCEFIDATIVEKGIDIEALAVSQNCDRYELTDEWREW